MSDHDHYGEYAEERHRHYDLERDNETAQQDLRGLREDLRADEERIRQLGDDLRDALERIRALEDRQPDYADERKPEPEEYDPGPEVDDVGGASEHRYLITPEEPW